MGGRPRGNASHAVVYSQTGDLLTLANTAPPNASTFNNVNGTPILNLLDFRSVDVMLYVASVTGGTFNYALNWEFVLPDDSRRVLELAVGGSALTAAGYRITNFGVSGGAYGSGFTNYGGVPPKIRLYHVNTGASTVVTGTIQVIGRY